jgi:predicted nucleic acid-binding protein
MSAEFFLDTNILVYSFDTDNLAKQTIARRLIDRRDWFVSWQVVQEFSSVALHRFKVPLKQEDLGDYIWLRLWPACRVFPSEEVFQHALSIHGRFGFRFYDSLVLASAQAGGARVLYSEDFQHGQKIGDLKIVNPFANMAR